ncbi:hypothetical protein [Trabulsiella odontotermitis]|uniref:Uncharacterized protein n=1 Tax=Trabulsiella odontotermitis TaxID=379893 RepID=A0A0L0GQM2_9ENTR|nr:hypothetical protein [Trabulsiella odontotermitis]KNC90718.1 hypothetical protein GM31_03395 [Trabulsiella odontotermitis]
MYGSDFNGEVIIDSNEELLSFLAKRPAFNSNNFAFSFNESGFPQLNIFVKDNLCVLYFMGEEGESFVSCNEKKMDGVEFFYENMEGGTVTLARENIVPVTVMNEASKYFFETKIRPVCCEWMEL